MGLHIKRRRSKRELSLVVSGEWDMFAAKVFIDVLRHESLGQHSILRIDARDVDFMDVGGVSSLLWLYVRYREQGGKSFVLLPSRCVSRILCLLAKSRCRRFSAA